MITPNSTVIFLKTPFSKDNLDVLKFADKNAQTEYMITRQVWEFSNCQYVREDEREYLRINKNIDSMYQVNYCMFKNTAYSDKWFYAFITRVEYLNPCVTRVYIRLDVWQTFQFDFSFNNCFVERKSFIEDEYNSLSDSPSIGEYDTYSSIEWRFTGMGKFFLAFNTFPLTEDVTALADINLTCEIGNNPTGLIYMCFDKGKDMADMILKVANKGRADRIQSAFYLPYYKGNITKYSECNIDTEYFGKVQLVNAIEVPTDDVPVVEPTFSFPLPKEFQYKKQYTYPYSYLELTDMSSGKSIQLEWNRLNDLSYLDILVIPTFDGKGTYKVVPMNYCGQKLSYENALVVTPNCDFPLFNNVYAKYLQQNENIKAIQMSTSAFQTVGQVLSGNFGGAFGTLSSIGQSVCSVLNEGKLANQVTNTNGNIDYYLNQKSGLILRVKTMDTYHIEQANTFWYMFGYPMHKNMSPSYVGMDSNKFNYIKTNGCHINAENIPTNYADELNSYFDNGIRIWNRDFMNF